MIGIEQVKKRGAPKILISTTHSAGGELSPYIVMHLSREDHSLVPVISEFAIPEVAVMDPLPADAPTCRRQGANPPGP